MFKKIFLFGFIILLLNVDNSSAQSRAFINHTANNPLTILFDSDDEKTVEIAAYALAKDLELLTGICSATSNDLKQAKGDVIIIGSVPGSKIINDLLEKKLINIGNIQGKWEAFVIQSVRHPNKNIRRALVIAGSDKRGTAYGVFHLSELLGISPWNWWADVIPEKKNHITIPEINYTSSPPSVKYRGIFLNDECWGLNPWASKTYEPAEGNIGPKSYTSIFELLLRLRANFIWSAMHPCTNAFYKNPGNPQTAQNYGIIVGSSHAEPMLRNNVDEWDLKLMGDFNFFTNRDMVLRYWAERVKESRQYESIYTLGMRGIHDSGMVGAGSMQEQVDALQEIITEQRKLIEKYVSTDASVVPQAFTAYKEVLDVYDAGLQLPDDITLVWPDDNYGYIQRFSDSKKQKRKGGSGIYYHLSYWGRPHDYLWLSSTHPALIWEEMMKAAHFNSNQIWVVNVGDIKPLEYNIALFLDMAWNTGKFPSVQSVRNHMAQWYINIFGAPVGEIVAEVMWNYHQLNFERRPEFMGWSQTEPTRKTHFTEYNHFEAGDEAQQRIDRFDHLKQQVVSARKTVPARLHDAFYQLVEYPVVSAGLLNKKILYMEKAYLYAWQNRAVANDMALMAKAAYDSIVDYTDYYNNTMAGGKWQNMMYLSPRSLPVFDMPSVPQWQFAKSGEWGLAVEGDEKNRRVQDIKGPLNLPVFNRLTKGRYFIDVFMQGDQDVKWTAEPSSDWINASCLSGTLTAEMGIQQKRVWVSIDWDKTPAEKQLNGSIRFRSGNKTHTIGITAIQPDISVEGNSHFFVEDNGYISIYAENFNRVNNSGNQEWKVIEGLGYSGNSVWVNPLKSTENSQLQRNNILLSTLEYDFYTNKAKEITITVYVIPVHPINENFSTRFAISVNNETPQVADHRTFGRSEEWKLNVLRNSAIITTRHHLVSEGKQLLKIHAMDPGVIIDRIVIDCGGLVKTYSVLKETKVNY